MRKIIYWVHTSADGFVSGPNGEFDWPAVGPELFGHSDEINEGVDLLLYGRVVWEVMAEFWPTADEKLDDPHVKRFAPFWRETPKAVISRSLENPGWGATVIGKEGGDLAAEITELKSREGGDILLTGGASAAAALTELGLIDDIRVVVHPVVLGGGQQLFAGTKDRINLELVETRAFDGKTVMLRYSRKDS
ncbi:dihydrofolate reductase family protein [Actinomadura barringtoniae]|uniref:Dihydrofolate reductase family protein n=1 Tax=Actinomadura barringtoniae TaxID=1427535 RepID=A0A939TAF2_9ACTN|nr:dihydrofolate reductase family protein [Actinomadura barringtoniae]MBO2449005.1 dihydrofolate reductase family protein [Actinomadura barringtoniae]